MTQPSSLPDHAVDLTAYRKDARTWIEHNLEYAPNRPARREIGYYTPEVMAANRALQRRVFEAGYAGITWPQAFGGQGLSEAYEVAFTQEAADFALPDFGPLTNTTFGICVPTMIAHASEDFLGWFVPKVLVGEALVCQFFSEPSSGSDLAGARTRADRDGEEWLLNGQKTWSTFAHLADWGLCLARTNWQVPKHRGLTWFAVPCHASGVSIRPILQMNETSEFCEDFFDDVKIPDFYRVGEVDRGWTAAQTMLVLERGAGRPADAASDGPAGPGPLAPDLVRLAVGARGTSQQMVRQLIAQAHSNDFMGRALTARIGQRAILGDLNTGNAAYVKLFRGVYNPVRARIALEIGGTAAVAWNEAEPEGAATSTAYLNGRRDSIAGGTNEMQRNAIAERVLGLPRETSYDTQKPFDEVLRDARNWTS